MTAATTYTWDFNLGIVPPLDARAASLDDLGGAQLVDDAVYPPIPPQMPYAAQLNQWALQLAGVNRVVPALVVEIHYIAGVPTIINATGMSSIITTTWATTGAPNNLLVTHVGTGIVQITWAAGTLPNPRRRPRADPYTNSPVPVPNVTAVSNGVQVATWNLSGVLTDTDFTVEVY